MEHACGKQELMGPDIPDTQISKETIQVQQWS